MENAIIKQLKALITILASAFARAELDKLMLEFLTPLK